MVNFIVCFLAGLGAGLGTGFAGMSAAAVISPILITFLGIKPYSAVGIALASDVLASAVSAYTYKKHKNIDIKNGIIMMICVLIFTMVGSFVSSFVPSNAMGTTSTFMTLILGIKFIVKPVKMKIVILGYPGSGKTYLSDLLLLFAVLSLALSADLSAQEAE